MTKKINNLTTEQEAFLPVFRQKYLDIASTGARINRDRLHDAVGRAYESLGYSRPELIICSSPMAAMKKINELSLSENKFVSDYLWGTQDLYWIAWGKFAQEIGVVFDEDTLNKLDIMETISTECEWWWPFENVVVCSEKPLYVKWDDQGRMHGEGVPAVKYEDGYSLYSWHGVSVPEEWITDKAITAADALRWENMEQRRAACEILGWANILKELDAKVIDRDEDPTIGELLEVEIPDIGREKFLRVLCGTGREFAIPVPPNMKTALSANAWTFAIPDDVLASLEVRT
jgi:hypothetical protein